MPEWLNTNNFVGAAVIAFITAILTYFVTKWVETHKIKKAEESAAQSENRKRRTIAIEEIDARIRSWLSQCEVVKDLDRQPPETLKFSDAITIAGRAAWLSDCAREIQQIVDLYTIVFNSTDFNQLSVFAREVERISRTFATMVPYSGDNRDVTDQPRFVSTALHAMQKFIQDESQFVKPKHDALLETFRRLNWATAR